MIQKRLTRRRPRLAKRIRRTRKFANFRTAMFHIRLDACRNGWAERRLLRNIYAVGAYLNVVPR